MKSSEPERQGLLMDISPCLCASPATHQYRRNENKRICVLSHTTTRTESKQRHTWNSISGSPSDTYICILQHVCGETQPRFFISSAAGVDRFAPVKSWVLPPPGVPTRTRVHPPSETPTWPSGWTMTGGTSLTPTRRSSVRKRRSDNNG